VNPYAIGAAVAAIGVVGGLFGVVVAAHGKDNGSVFRTRATKVRPAGARALSRRRLIRFGGAAAAALVVWLVTGWPVGALLVGTLVLTRRFFFGGGKIAVDRIERLEGLEQWVRHLSDSMASGSMPVQTIVRSADHAPPAIHDQVARLATRLSTPRLDRNEALRRFADEIDDALGDIIVLALQRAVSTRGSERVPYVLQALAEAVGAEVKARRAIEKERAGPRKETQAIVVVLGIFVGGLVVFTQYPKVYGSVQGQVVLLILGSIVLLGLWTMRRLSVGGQPPRILSEVKEPAAP
jgi:Flp pilus assembly protein TadB